MRAVICQLLCVSLLLAPIPVQAADLPVASGSNPSASSRFLSVCSAVWHAARGTEPKPAEPPTQTSWWQHWNLWWGKGTRHLSPETFALFDRVRKNPADLPSPEEMAAHRERMKKEGVEPLFDSYVKASWWVRHFNHYRALWYRSRLHVPPLLNLKRFDQAMGDMMAAPTLLFRMRLIDIYAKVAKQHDVELTKREMEKVRAYFLEADLAAFRKDVKEGKIPENQRNDPKELRREWSRLLVKDMKDVTSAMLGMGTDAVRGFLSLIGIPAVLRNIGLHSLANSILRNPNYEPRPGRVPILNYMALFDDPRFIKKWGLEKEVERYKTDAEKYGVEYARIQMMRRMRTYMMAAVLGSILAGATIPDDVIEHDESFDENHPKGMKDSDVGEPYNVELIYNAGLPSVAIRVDGTYYFYGDYDIPSATDALTKEEYKKEEDKLKELLTSGGHTRIKLKLNEKEETELLTRLLARTGKKHVSLPLIHGGIKEANDDLAAATGIKIPPVADRSQAGTMAYLRLQKMLGNERVARITFASRDQKVATAKAKDIALTLLESAWFLENAHKLIWMQPLYEEFINPPLVERLNEEKK